MLGVSTMMLLDYNSVCMKPENAVKTQLPGHTWESADCRYVWGGFTSPAHDGLIIWDHFILVLIQCS